MCTVCCWSVLADLDLKKKKDIGDILKPGLANVPHYALRLQCNNGAIIACYFNPSVAYFCQRWREQIGLKKEMNSWTVFSDMLVEVTLIIG